MEKYQTDLNLVISSQGDTLPCITLPLDDLASLDERDEWPAIYIFASVKQLGVIEEIQKHYTYDVSVVYIGQTDNLRRRMQQHSGQEHDGAKLPCARKHGATHVLVHFVDGVHEDRRIAFEQELIKRFAPVCNEQYAANALSAWLSALRK